MPDKALRMHEVKARVGYGKSTIYELKKKNQFPQSFNLGLRAVAWLESDIDRWIAERVKLSCAATTGSVSK